MRTCFLPLALLIILVVSNCTSPRKAMIIKSSNQYYLYNPGSTFMHPEFTLFNNTDTSSQLFIKYFTDEILFNQANSDQTMQAELNIKYQLFDITADKVNPTLADSATANKIIEKRNARKVVVIPIFLKALAGKEYTLRIVSLDVNRKASHTTTIYLNKLDSTGGQNFKLIQMPGGAPLFRSYISKDDMFKIVSGRSHFDNLYIGFKKNDLPLPAPAFSMTGEKVFEFQGDSIFKVAYSQTQNFNFPEEGIYFIRTDSTQKSGLYLMNFGKSYPRIKTVQEMLKPLEYITTTVEFRNLNSSPNQKIGLDNFWLKLSGGNTDVSRELIRVYYNRVFYANYYFTSFKEGWKTDRGMIYVIFGQPNYITKDAGSEVWEYYNAQDGKTVEFHFVKTSSPYTENHYVLTRDGYFNGFWRQAVDYWRSGKVYSAEE